MDFSVESSVIEKQSSACIIVGVFELSRLSPSAEKLNKISENYISSLLRRGELEGKIGQALLLHHVPNFLSEHILLVGCGKELELDERQYKQIINKMTNTLSDIASTEAMCFLTELNVKERDIYWKIRYTIETVKDTLYTFNRLKSNKTKQRRFLRKVIFNISNREALNESELAILHGLAISDGIKIAKDLGNLPPNICNSNYLALKARQLTDKYKKSATVQSIDEKKMKELGMNAYLAVGQGSTNESIMLVIEHKGHPNPAMQPIVLVGKGLTFDTGGISIKTADNMDEMKYDMCGAATVYGVMSIVLALKLPLNIVGILACCENMIGNCALRPGDVLTTLSGQTVEVLNTDAEGRLVLCDVLTYVERFNPDVVIDVATLTGACVIALGHHLTGVMSNCNQLAHELIIASEQSGDRAWHLPLGDEFQEQLESNFADMSNVGGRSGGAITAGCFLSRFTRQYNWAHLDIAGTAWKSGKSKGATGRPVAMLAQFLLNRARVQSQ